MKRFQRLMGEANKRMKVNNQKASEASTRSSIPFETKKFDLSIQKCLSQTPESITVGLDACQIAIFRDKKMNLLRCLIFKEFLFIEKGFENGTTPFLNQIVKINLSEPNRLISS